jgi:NAD(P)-dependent dehydrogenase (short-subunit alcohol dehydrogenase family)
VAAASPFLSILVDAVSKTPDAGFLPLEVDPADEHSVACSIRSTREAFGRIDIVVNNAGYGAADPLDTAMVMRNVLPWMRVQGSGHVINVGLPADVGLSADVGLPADVGLSHPAANVGLSDLTAEDMLYPGIHMTSVVLGASRSPVQTEQGSVPAMIIPIDGRQIGDPQKAAAALIGITGLPKPPQLLFLTSKARLLATEKMAALPTI